MYKIGLKLGLITAVDPQNKKINIVDLTSGNLTSENYQNVYYPDTLAHQEVPKVGYYLLFAVLYSIPNRQDMVIPIKYFASTVEGDTSGSEKRELATTLQEEGDQVFSSGVSTLLLQSMVASLTSGSQSIELNCDGSKMSIEYDSLEIKGTDGFVIKQEQDSHQLTVSKGNTLITIDDDNVTISTNNSVNLKANNILIGEENTVKGQSLLQWLNTHTHSNGNNGSPTGTPINQAQDTLLVKEQQ